MRRKKSRVEEKKKQEESDESNDPFCRLSLDLNMEILKKLPVKSVAKLVFVSKHLASTILSREFTDLYMARPRLLFRTHRNLSLHLFHSCSQENPSHDRSKRVSISLDSNFYYGFSPPVRGLICGQDDTKLFIGNPSTGQFVNLPSVRTRRKGIYSFFGYEPVNHVYKVLCMTVKGVTAKRGSGVVSEEHQVLTLGGKENESWRMIKCNHPHLLLHPHHKPVVCMNGVLYYYAWVKGFGSIISFDLRSEEFNVIKLPEDVRILDKFTNLVNFSGKVALTSWEFNGTLDLRVLDDAGKQEWSKVSAVVPSWSDLAGRASFLFKGAISTGELVFATEASINPYYYISYDLKENNAKRVVIEKVGANSDDFDIFFDHVDSPMVL